jgi:hypothetical protein
MMWKCGAVRRFEGFCVPRGNLDDLCFVPVAKTSARVLLLYFWTEGALPPNCFVWCAGAEVAQSYAVNGRLVVVVVLCLLK